LPLWLQTKKIPKNPLGLRTDELMFTSCQKKKSEGANHTKDFFSEKWAHMNVRENFLEVTYLDNRNSSILPKYRNIKFSNFL